MSSAEASRSRRRRTDGELSRRRILDAATEIAAERHRKARAWVPQVPSAGRRPARSAVAGADGLFIAKEIGGDAVDLVVLLELHARAVYETAMHLISERQPS